MMLTLFVGIKSYRRLGSYVNSQRPNRGGCAVRLLRISRLVHIPHFSTGSTADVDARLSFAHTQERPDPLRDKRIFYSIQLKLTGFMSSLGWISRRTIPLEPIAPLQIYLIVIITCDPGVGSPSRPPVGFPLTFGIKEHTS
jgi:hypothetical protein